MSTNQTEAIVRQQKRTLDVRERKSTLCFHKAFKNQVCLMRESGYSSVYKKSEFDLFAIEGNELFEQIEDLRLSWNGRGGGFTLVESVFISYAEANRDQSVDVMKMYSTIVLLVSKLIEKEKTVELLANMFSLFDEVQDNGLLLV